MLGEDPYLLGMCKRSLSELSLSVCLLMISSVTPKSDWWPIRLGEKGLRGKQHAKTGLYKELLVCVETERSLGQFMVAQRNLESNGRANGK